MTLGQNGLTESVDRADRFELQVGPEGDSDGLLLAALAPPGNDTLDQDYVTLVRRATPQHADMGEELFHSCVLPVIPGSELTQELANLESPFQNLKLDERIETLRLTDDGTKLRAELRDDGLELIHVGPGDEKYQVALGLPVVLAQALWNDFKNGEWLPVGKSVFPDGDPTIAGDHEID